MKGICHDALNEILNDELSAKLSAYSLSVALPEPATHGSL